MQTQIQVVMANPGDSDKNSLLIFKKYILHVVQNYF